MDVFSVGIIGVVVLIALLMMGVYVAVALGLVGFIGTAYFLGFSPATSLLASTTFHYGTEYTFIVIPLFVAMGLFAAEEGISKDAYDALAKWIGNVRGGLGIATIGACTIFGTLTGSSVVTSVVFAKVSVPEMRRHGYDASISYGLVCTAGAIGMLIPPSLLAVVYSLITGESLGQLLLAGIGPGLLLTAGLIVAFVALLTFRPSLGPTRAIEGVSWRERLIALPQLWPAFVVAIVMIGGVYFGVFTVVEAAGIGTAVLLLLYFAIKGVSKRSLQTVTASLREAVALTSMILLILITAQIFARFLVLTELGTALADFVVDAKLSSLQFLLAAVVLTILLGMLIDSVSILAIIVPVLYPIAQAMSIDPLWFAMVIVFATQVGLITPPFALTVFAVKAVAEPGINLEDIFRGTMFFLVVMIIILAILILIPDITTWIPYNMWQS
jgi:tripartite ATP-independent transporter DctM subunit